MHALPDAYRMTYCSYETRKVVECLDEYGIATDEYFDIELDIAMFWNTHMQMVIRQVLDGGNAAKKLAKVEALGWQYFKKPIRSLLTPRGAAHRAESIAVLEPVRPIYNAISKGFLRADFNMKELALIVEIAPMITDMNALSNAFRAAGEQRSVYYLHGIIRREYQSRQGKIREIQKQQEETQDLGWQPPENFEKVDLVDRRMAEADWQERLNNIAIKRALDG